MLASVSPLQYINNILISCRYYALVVIGKKCQKALLVDVIFSRIPDDLPEVLIKRHSFTDVFITFFQESVFIKNVHNIEIHLKNDKIS